MAALKWKVTSACWFGLTKQQIDSTESAKTSKRKIRQARAFIKEKQVINQPEKKNSLKGVFYVHLFNF